MLVRKLISTSTSTDEKLSHVPIVRLMIPKREGPGFEVHKARWPHPGLWAILKPLVVSGRCEFTSCGVPALWPTKYKMVQGLIL